MLEFDHDPETHQYLVTLDGSPVGLIDYTLADGVADFTHTEVNPETQGQGIAGQLTRYALDDVRAQGWRLIPTCPYTRSWVDRHPEYADLLA